MTALAAVTFSSQASTVISLIVAALVCALLTSGELRRFGPFVWLVEAATLFAVAAGSMLVGLWALLGLPLALAWVIAFRHVVVMRRMLDAEAVAVHAPATTSAVLTQLGAQGFMAVTAAELRPRQAPPMRVLLLVDPRWATYAHVSDPDGPRPLLSLHTLLPGGRLVTASRAMAAAPETLLQAVTGGEPHQLVAQHRRTLQWAHEHGAPVVPAAPEHALAEYQADLADDQAWLRGLGLAAVVRTMLPVDASTPIQQRPDAPGRLQARSRPR
jgi:hypothetical protein